MLDKNGIEIKIGAVIEVPEPDETDAHSHSFQGYVDGFRHGCVIVMDGDGDAFEVEPERLETVSQDFYL